MAKNRRYEHGNQLDWTVPAGTTSGAPVAIGQVVGVAMIDRGADGRATVQRDGVYLLEVRGVDGAGNSAVAEGDRLFFTAADAVKLSKKATGVPFGYAREAVAGGQTKTIEVVIGA